MEEENEYNIYENLEDFNYELKYKEKLEEIEKLSEQVKSLEKKLVEHENENKSLKKTIKNYEKNCSSLLKTAQNELKRKDNIISELQLSKVPDSNKKKHFENSRQYIEKKVGDKRQLSPVQKDFKTVYNNKKIKINNMTTHNEKLNKNCESQSRR